MFRKILEKNFRSDSFDFEQICRENNVAIYKKSKRGIDGPIESFETVLIDRHDGFEIAGNVVEPAEVYPPNSAWGKHAWSHKTLEAAQTKFEWLKQNVNEDKFTATKTQSEFAWPDGEFDVQTFAALNQRSITWASNFLKETAVLARKEKLSGKGKPKNIWRKKP